MTYQFKIQIQGIQKPSVWRRLLIPDDTTFDTFHEVIQSAFGWRDYHLYQFSSQGWTSKSIFKIPDEEYDDETVKDSRIVKVSQIFSSPKQTFNYIYDFGDNWEHRIILEEILDEVLIGFKCIDGKGACPPEDCGGVPGYMNLIKVLSNPKEPDYKEFRKWLGLRKDQQWDVIFFDINAVNAQLGSFSL